MSDSKMKIKKLLTSQNQIAVDLSSSGHIQPEFPDLQELKKNSVNINSVSSFTFEGQQSNNSNCYQEKQGLLLRFFRILKTKSRLINKNRQKFFIFQSIFQEKSLRSNQKSKLEHSKYLIHPKKTIYLVFQFLKCLQLIVLLTTITYFWSFKILDILDQDKIHFFIAILLLLDILSQFNLAIIIRGQMIYDRKTICQTYLKNQFISDFIFMISLILIVETENYFFFFTFFISGILNLFKIIRQLEELIDLNPKNMELIKLVKLLFLLNIIAHFMACIWHFVGDIGQFKKNWIDEKGIRLESNYVIYIYSFYWSVATMVTVGYGDITPQNHLEMIVCIFSMFLSCGIYAYSLNIVGQIVQTFTQQSDKLEKNIRTLNNYFKQHNIKEQLQRRIKNYLEYKILEEDWQKNEDIYQILNELPIHFKEKLLSGVFLKLVSQCPILSENFSNKLIQKTSNFIQPINFEANEFIIKQNQENENSLYFIDVGTVQLFEQQSKTIITEFNSGEYFGDYEFFTNQTPKFSIKCKTATKVLKLKRSDFLEILNKDSFEIFHEIKQKMEFNIPIQQQRLCFACQQNDHLIQNCNRIFYKPNMTKLFLRQENLQQFRQLYCRSNLKSNCLKFLNIIKKRQYHFIQDYQQESSQNQITLTLNEIQNIEIDTLSQPVSLLLNKLKAQDFTDIRYDKDKNETQESGQNNKRLSGNSQNQQMQSVQQLQKKQQTFTRLEKYQSYNQIDLDRMKDFNNFFSNKNSINLIKSYNRNNFDRNLQIQQSRKQSKAMKYIEF